MDYRIPLHFKTAT